MTLIPEVRHELLTAARRRRRPWYGRRPAGSRPVLAVGGGLVAALAAVIVVFVFSATSATSRAYALTMRASGTYTLTLYRLTEDIPQLNARLAHMGIDETVVPVTSSCTHQFPIYADGTDSTTITLYTGRRYLEPGYQGVLAAEALPSGKIALAQGALLPSEIPGCFATLAHTHITILSKRPG